MATLSAVQRLDRGERFAAFLLVFNVVALLGLWSRCSFCAVGALVGAIDLNLVRLSVFGCAISHLQMLMVAFLFNVSERGSGVGNVARDAPHRVTL